LAWTAGNGGFDFAKSGCANAIELSGFAVTTQVAGGGTAISITGACSNGQYPPLNKIEDVTDRGDDGYGVVDCWTIGLAVYNDSWYTVTRFNDEGPTAGTVNGFASATSGGTGIYLEGSANPVDVIFNFQSSSSLRSVALTYGNEVQGVTVSGGGNFTGCHNGIVVPAHEVGTGQLTIVGDQFACASTALADATGVFGLNSVTITSLSRRPPLASISSSIMAL
jgi:hypothetical protein